MSGPKRFTSPVKPRGQETGLLLDPEGNLVYWSEYEALAEAFAIYAEVGMDEPSDIQKVLADHLGADDAQFVAEFVGERMTKAPPKPDKGGKKP